MQRKLFFLLFFISILFYNCKNENNKNSNLTTSTPSVSSASKGFYKHLKGTIDSFPVTMDLVQVKKLNNDLQELSFFGHYYYDKYQQPIDIYGELDSLGNIVLHEWDINNNDIHFMGKMDAAGTFSGTWRDTLTKRTLPFTLKETYADGAMSFDFYSFQDSAKLWKNVPESPMAQFDIEMLLPSKNTEGVLAAFLRDKIFKGIKADSVDISYTNVPIESFVNANRDTFFANYYETLKEEKPDSTSIAAATFNYAESSTMSVIYNDKHFLSLGFSEYAYSGGAHGNHGTGISTYDLDQKKQLTLKDVFLPKFEKTLDKAVENAARRQFKLKKNEPLTTYLFDNSIKHTDNFCITKKGIVFHYNPYEIAAYAFGEIKLFVPFEEVKSVVNPRFL